MDFECHGKIAVDREQVVHVNDTVFPTSNEKPAIWGEFGTHYIIRMPVFILFQKYEGLKGPPQRRRLVNHEAMGLGDAKKFAIVAKTSSGYRAFEIVFCNGEHAFDIENNGIANNIYGNQDDSRRMEGNGTDLVMGLEGKNAGSIIFEVDLLDIVEDWREESVCMKDDVATHVGTAEQVLSLHSIVEHHG